jgi:hypothetical protein
MKYAGNEEHPVEEWKPNDKYWIDELPSIYNLDAITREMNNQHNDINKTFKLNVKTWNRDEIRVLMDNFKLMYDCFCRINNRKITLMEACAKQSSFVNCSFWQHWKSLRQFI